MTSLAHCQDILADLVRFPTISSDENATLIQYINALLVDRDVHCEIQAAAEEGKANLFARIGPDVAGGVVLSGHTDVVPVEGQDWTSDPFTLREEAGRLYGRGTCDMKGFVAACLAMAPRFAASPLKKPIYFAFTYDEEVGCIGGQHLVEMLAARGIAADAAIIGEPTDMRMIEGHKGCHEYAVDFTGLAGHGSDPDRGVNAAEYAARYVGRLLDLREELKARVPADSRFDPPFSTVSIGRIEGGFAPNVIAEACTVEWDFRPVNAADLEFATASVAQYVDDILLPAMRKIRPDAGIVTRILGSVAGLEPVPDNEAVRIVSTLTGANHSDVVSFCTEAGLFQRIGIPAVVCGPGSIEQAHKPDEFIDLDQLQACLDMLEALAQHLSGDI